MAYKSVILPSDNLPCKVRQLGLFELNGKGRELLGPYKYSLLLATGQVVEDEYDIRALDEIPRPPKVAKEDIKPGSPEWYQLEEYETYTCAIAHEKKRVESYHGYVDDIIAYILENCISPEDRTRIISPGDWEMVYQAVFVPELTMEVISATLRDVFQGFLWWTGDTRRHFRHLQWSGQGGGAGSVGA